ncbi:MAG: DHH family phosphoesterase [Candidatus Micrarchaeia archaeon]
MIKTLTFDELLELVKRYSQQDVLITFHSIGDRDAVGSAVALSEYMHSSIVAMPDFLTNNARRMLASVEYEKKISAKFVKTSAVIVTDADNTEVLGPFSKELYNYSGEVLFIDHHLKSDNVKAELPNASAVYMFTDEKFNSTSSIVYALLKRLGASIGKEVALLLANGITADSADLQNADALTFMQLSELFSISGTTYASLQEMYHSSIPLVNRLMTMQDVKNASLESTGKYLIVYGKATEHANVAADAAMNLGADAAVFWSITPYEASISGRLRSPLDKQLGIHLGVYMRGVAALLNGTGGGHACAAGAYGPEKGKVEQAALQIVGKLKEAMK